MAVNGSTSMRSVFKFMMPAMGTFMVIVLLYGNPIKIWAIVPVLLIALYFTAAELRVEGKHIYYRRAFSWRKLPDDITDAHCSLFPVLGCIKFRHFVPPWGRLYYIVEFDEGTFIPFRKTAFMQTMLSPPYMRQETIKPRPDENDSAEKMNERTRLTWVLSSIAGLMVGILIPVPWQHETPFVISDTFTRFLLIQRNYIFLVLCAAILIGLIIRFRARGFASVWLAFLIGIIVSHLAHMH